MYAKIYKKCLGVELVIPSDSVRILENYLATVPLSEESEEPVLYINSELCEVSQEGCFYLSFSPVMTPCFPKADIIRGIFSHYFKFFEILLKLE